MTNSRQKGARGERAQAGFLSSEGFPAERGVQHKGGPDSPDVICPTLDTFSHQEVKWVERYSVNDMYDALTKCGLEAPGKMPLLFYTKNHYDWLMVTWRHHGVDLLRSHYAEHISPG